MTNEELQNAPYPRYIYSALPDGKGVVCVKQFDPLHTEQWLIPEENFIDLVKQWKDMRRREAVGKIEIARSMPNNPNVEHRVLQLVD